MKDGILVYTVVVMIGVGLVGFMGLSLFHAFAQLGQMVTRF